MALEATTSTGGLEEQLVVFRLRRELYGVPISSVREIIRWQQVTSLPTAPEFVEGVINLRGTVVPVIDLAKRFAIEGIPATNDTRIVVVEMSGQLVGIVVDGVSEVLRITHAEIEPPSSISGSVDIEFLRGVGKSGDRLIVLLDLTRVLSPAEAAALSDVELAAQRLDAAA